MFEQSRGGQDEEIKEEKFGQGQAMMGVNVNHTSTMYNQINGQGRDGGEINDSQYNIDETNESFSERKNQTNIPSLKNNKNALNKATKPFSERLLSG